MTVDCQPLDQSEISNLQNVFTRFGNRENLMNGLDLLSEIPSNSIPLAFFDPQYRGIMDKMRYGNEGARQKDRFTLHQMNEETIMEFISEISRILKPSGHAMLWVDKFHLCSGIFPWLVNSNLSIVDMMTWDKGKIGMGYRTRRRSEYMIILQKMPLRAKGLWRDRGIPDVIQERQPKNHPHAKPEEMQRRLIMALTDPGDWVCDPAAGGYSVMRSAMVCGRNFIGADLGKI